MHIDTYLNKYRELQINILNPEKNYRKDLTVTESLHIYERMRENDWDSKIMRETVDFEDSYVVESSKKADAFVK